jgi:hypothetical protein
VSDGLCRGCLEIAELDPARLCLDCRTHGAPLDPKIISAAITEELRRSPLGRIALRALDDWAAGRRARKARGDE